MASTAKRRKCFSTKEVLEFLVGSSEDDETLGYTLEGLDEDSDGVSGDSTATDTESVADLCGLSADVEVVSGPDLLKSDELEPEVDNGTDVADNTAVGEVCTESTADGLEVDASLMQRSGMLWDSSDTEEAAAESGVSDSVDDERSSILCTE